MPETAVPSPLATLLANRIRSSRDELTERWLSRIAARVDLDPNRIFPSEELLNHVPLLIDGIASYVEVGALELTGDTPIVAKAMELGGIRYEQGFDEYEILKEFELLGSIVFTFMVREMSELPDGFSSEALLMCSHRVFLAISLIQTATMTHYLQRLRARISRREDQLRGFHRALSHELKNQIGAAMGAADIIDLDGLSEEERRRLASVVRRNVKEMHEMLENLLELSRAESDSRRQRRVRLPQAVAEVVRQLREPAEAAGVVVRVEELPDIEVSAAAVELAITNYLTNAIKYRECAAETSWVTIRAIAAISPDGHPETVVEVCDNGMGVPEGRREKLFGRGFRAHLDNVVTVDGTGLGLSIAKDAIESIGGRVWATFPPEGGSCFALAIPARRESEPGS